LPKKEKKIGLKREKEREKERKRKRERERKRREERYFLQLDLFVVFVECYY